MKHKKNHNNTYMDSLSWVKKISKSMKTISTAGVVLILIVAVLFIHSLVSHRWKREGMQTKNIFTLYEGSDVYDDFYADIYDHLVFNKVLNDYETTSLIQKTSPNSESIILDIGCGTGHDTKALSENGYAVIGMDISKAMVAKAKESYPDLDFVQGDALNAQRFQPSSFTHIVCLYFTVYYMQDMNRFFSNVFSWLMPGGYFVLHLVDRDMFDPILPPANPLMLLSPQRYAKERIKESKVTFNHFKYKAHFDINEETDTALFIENIHFNDGKKRKNEHKMYMPHLDTMVQMVQDVGFLVQGKIDLIKAGYEYQYLYIFTRPN